MLDLDAKVHGRTRRNSPRRGVHRRVFVLVSLEERVKFKSSIILRTRKGLVATARKLEDESRADPRTCVIRFNSIHACPECLSRHHAHWITRITRLLRASVCSSHGEIASITANQVRRDCLRTTVPPISTRQT